LINLKRRATRRSEQQVVGTFQASVDDPSILARWPADFRITADYRVAAGALALTYVIENPDRRPLPFGLGTHPYFRVPLGSDRAGDCRVMVPVTNAWELVDLLPTGMVTTPPEAAALAAGMTFGEMHLDNVFGGVTGSSAGATATVHDPASGRRMTMTFDDTFKTCVVFNPPHRQAVCIEPYTTVPDPFRLQTMGVDPHLLVLPPGGSLSMSIAIRLD
jgi:aldose 1-epimerase